MVGLLGGRLGRVRDIRRWCSRVRIAWWERSLGHFRSGKSISCVRKACWLGSLCPLRKQGYTCLHHNCFFRDNRRVRLRTRCRHYKVLQGCHDTSRVPSGRCRVPGGNKSTTSPRTGPTTTSFGVLGFARSFSFFGMVGRGVESSHYTTSAKKGEP